MAIKTALVVDDSRSARLMLQKMLNKKSLETNAVENGEAAIEYLKDVECYPDVIFMDHMMPGMDGLEATEKISGNSETDSIPIVMFTSKEDEDYLETARSHGAKSVLRKPATPSDLDEVIAYVSSLSEPVEDQAMQTATASPQINRDEIETMVENILPAALAEQMLVLKSEIISELPKFEATADIQDAVTALEGHVEILHSRLATMTDTFESQQLDVTLSEEVMQQVVTTAEGSAKEISSATAETVAAQIAEKVAKTTLQNIQSEQSEDYVKLTGSEYRRLKTMSSVGLLAAISALIVAIF